MCIIIIRKRIHEILCLSCESKQLFQGKNEQVSQLWAELRGKKNSAALPVELLYQVNWDLAVMWVHDKPNPWISLFWLIMDPHNSQLPIGLIVQLVEHALALQRSGFKFHSHHSLATAKGAFKAARKLQYFCVVILV